MFLSFFGFLRVAAAVPRPRVADCAYNAERDVAPMRRAHAEQLAGLCFPELATIDVYRYVNGAPV